jgi:hypothetical protein
MPVLKPGKTIELGEPLLTIEIDPNDPLLPGTYQIQLAVTDSQGNVSEPVVATLTISGDVRPKAAIKAPDKVEFGKDILLSAEGSKAVLPGGIKSYQWTLLSRQ